MHATSTLLHLSIIHLVIACMFVPVMRVLWHVAMARGSRSRMCCLSSANKELGGKGNVMVGLNLVDFKSTLHVFSILLWQLTGCVDMLHLLTNFVDVGPPKIFSVEHEYVARAENPILMGSARQELVGSAAGRPQFLSLSDA